MNLNRWRTDSKGTEESVEVGEELLEVVASSLMVEVVGHRAGDETEGDHIGGHPGHVEPAVCLGDEVDGHRVEEAPGETVRLKHVESHHRTESSADTKDL